jgi:hypothetical protein
MRGGSVLSAFGALVLLLSGCSSDGGAASDTTIAPSTATGITMVTVPIDADVVATVIGDTLSIDFSARPIDRSMSYTVATDAGPGGAAEVVGHLATEGGPGTFIALSPDRPPEFPDGLVTGPGPDVFDVSDLPSARYTACTVTMKGDAPGLLCVGFTRG